MSLKNLLESLDKISESAYFKTTSTGREVTVGGKKATVLGQIPTNQGSAKYYAIRFTDKKYPGDTYDQIHANKIFDQLGESDVSEAAKPDFLDLDGDGNKTEPMKSAAADKKDPPFDPDETQSSDKDQFGNTIKHRARHLARKGMKQASGVKEGDVTKTATGRVHRAKAGGYGRKIDRDDDSGDRFHSSDIDDVDDAPAAPAVKRGRGRPMKGGDSETGQVKKYDTDTLASWIIGNKPKTLPKGVSSTKHKLKDWMERVETSMISESLIIEGAMGEISAMIDDIRSGELDVYDLLSGKFRPTSKAEKIFVIQLQKKYDEIAAERGLHADDDFEKITDILIDELDSVLSEQDQVTIAPAKSNTQVIKQGDKVVGQVENPQLANTIKQAIGQGQMTLAGADLKESFMPGMNQQNDGPHHVIMLFPHEHKMYQDGWGMDEAFADALADYYHQQGKIPHGVWRGPMDSLRDFVEECYATDTGMGGDMMVQTGSSEDYADERVSETSPRGNSMKDLMRTLDEYASEENQDGDHSAITGDENTTTPDPMTAMYPSGKENSSMSHDVVNDTQNKKMAYESKSTAKRDEKAEKAGKRVTKDLEYDMKHRGKDDKKAERAGKKVTKDIEWDEKKEQLDELSKSTLGSYVKKAEGEYGKSPHEPAVKLPKDVRASAVKHRAGIKKAKSKLTNLDEGKFGQMDADLEDLSPEEFKKEYGMTKAEARAKHGAAKSDTKKIDEMDNPDRHDDAGKKEIMVKPITVKKMKKDAGKALDTAFKKEMPKKVKEAWDTDYETPESEKGKYKDKTIAELKKMKETLMKKEKRTKAEQGRVAELNFAIRAKQEGGGKWGKVKKESRDIQMETWEKRLGSMLAESVTVNTSSGTEPDTRSVNISATGEDADQLMAMLQNAGLHTGATSSGYQPVQYQSDEQMFEETTDAEFMIPEKKQVKEENTAEVRDGEEYDGTGSPAVTTKTPGSDPHSKFDDAEDVPIMAMPRGMGVSQNVEDELAEVIEPVTPQDVIGELDAEDSSNDDMAFIKKVMNHGASQYADSAPNDGEQEEPVSGGASTSMGPISGEMGKQNVAEVEADVEEGNEFSGNLAKAKASGAKEFEVDGKKYPVKEDDYQDEDETNEGYEDGNLAAERSDDKIQDADAASYRAGAATTNRDSDLAVTEAPAGGRKGDDDLADPTFAGKNRQARVTEGDDEVCSECGGMYEGRGHQCSESLNEWANSPQGQSADEQFETDMEFMTKVISGGLNNQKQDQTTLPSTRVRTGAESPPRGADTSIGADLKRLAGIN